MAVKPVVAGSTVKIGQLEDLMRQLKDGSLNGDQLQALLEHRNPFGVQTKPAAEKILERIGKQTIECVAYKPPSTFWKTGLALWVDSGLGQILATEEHLSAGPVAFNRHLIKKSDGVLDSEIRQRGAGLAIKNTFTSGQFLQLAQTLIVSQSNGSAGYLLNDGKVNIFYVMCGGVVFTVCVDWDRVGRQWNVNVWRYDDDRWGAGRQVFSPAT